MSTLNQLPNEENIIFNCDRHAKSTSKRLLSFYEKKELFDTVLITDSGLVEFQAHKVVLSALSEYFFEMFRGGLTTDCNSKPYVVELKEKIEDSTLKMIIDFMYSGSIEINLETVERLLRAAAFLKITTLIDECCEFINKNLNSVGNCLYWLRLAKEYNLPAFKEKSLNFIYTNFEEVSKEKEFLLLSELELKDLLFNDNPYQDFEELVLLSLMTWIEYDKGNRENLLIALLNMVRYQFLTPRFIIEKISSETEESFKLIHSWVRWHCSPHTRSIEQQNVAPKPKRRKLNEKLALIYCNSYKEIEILSHIKKKDSWVIKKRSPLWQNKSGFSMIVIDAQLIVVGGRVEFDLIINSVEILDLNTLQWENLPPMNKTRSYCQLGKLNGNLFVFGGSDNNQHFVNTIELYNFSTRKWQFVQPLFKPSKYSKAIGHNGILYIIDLYFGHLQSYDIATNLWNSKAQQIEDLRNFGFAGVDRFLYLIGGYKNGDVKSVKRYDISNDTWCEVASLPKARSFFKCTTFENKIVIYDGNCNSCLVEEYNTETDSWKTLSKILHYNELLICSLPINYF